MVYVKSCTTYVYSTFLTCILQFKIGEKALLRNIIVDKYEYALIAYLRWCTNIAFEE